VGAYIFGFIDSTGSRLQPYGFPSQFVLAFPYFITIVILAIVLAMQKYRIEKQKSSLR
jgi:simple sugar transport system permease protein